MPGKQNKRAIKTFVAFSMFAAFGASACGIPVANSRYPLDAGVYCLDTDVSVDRIPAFTLGNDTVLDCRGHRIVDATSTTQNGVFGQGDNMTLKNCVFVGFKTAVYFYGSNFRIVGNSFTGARAVAIDASGNHGLVMGNAVDYAPVEDFISSAIQTHGIVDIIGNTVTSRASTEVFSRDGIIAWSDEGGVVARNLVRDFFHPAPGAGGVALVTDSKTVVYRNVFIAAPGAGAVGVHCPWYGFISQNIVVGYPQPYDPDVEQCIQNNQGRNH